MDVTAETTAIEREISIAASPETVWGFLVDPMKATRWMGQEAFFDPRPGGEYRVKVVNETAVGEFVELDPPRRLVFTWGWEGDPIRQSLITLTFRELGGKTELTLRQEGLGSVESRDGHVRGWTSALNKLDRHLCEGARR